MAAKLEGGNKLPKCTAQIIDKLQIFTPRFENVAGPDFVKVDAKCHVFENA